MHCGAIVSDAPAFERHSLSLTLAPGVGLPGRAWVLDRPVTIESIAKEPNFPRAATAFECGLVAGAALPLERDGRVVAVLEAFGDRPPDVAALARAGAGLDLDGLRAEPVSVAERSAARHAALAELGRRAVTTDDLDALVDETLRVVLYALAVDRAGLVERVDEATMAIRATVGLEGDRVGDAIPIAGTLTGHILAQDAPVAVTDVASDPRAAGSWMLHERGIASAAGVVVRGPERPVGVLAVHTLERREFAAEDIAFLRTSANLLAAAIARHRAGEELRRVGALLDAVVHGAGDAIFVKDAEGRYLFINEAGARVLGRPVHDVLGRVTEDVFPPDAAAAIRADDAAVMAAGEWQSLEEDFTLDGVTRTFLASKGPFRDAAGGVVGIIGIAHEITERKRAERHQAALAETSRLLAGALDVVRTLQDVAWVPVPAIADWCSVDVVDDAGGVELAALAHPDPERRALALDIRRRFPLSDAPGGVLDVIRTGRPAYVPQVDNTWIEAVVPAPERRRVLEEIAPTSIVIVPMIARGRTLGALTLASSGEGRRLDELDVAVAGEFARRAALAIDNARAFAERDRVARALQAGLLPPALPEIPGVRLATRYHAAGEGLEVGGDFYDVFPAPDGWIVVVGDVCGRGADAAALTAVVRHTLRGAGAFESGPARLLYALNAALLRARDDLRFCTILCAHLRIDGPALELTLADGGHPLPLALRADGTVTAHGRPGTLVGALPDPSFEEEVLRLEAGDAIAMFTDGLLDAGRPDRPLGAEAVEAVLRGAAGSDADALAGALADAAVEAAGGGLGDDVAVLVLQAGPGRP